MICCFVCQLHKCLPTAIHSPPLFDFRLKNFYKQNIKNRRFDLTTFLFKNGNSPGPLRPLNRISAYFINHYVHEPNDARAPVVDYLLLGFLLLLFTFSTLSRESELMYPLVDRCSCRHFFSQRFQWGETLKHREKFFP